MVVILSDDEAETVAAVLRRMKERVEAYQSNDAVAYVDNRGPEDFAEQLESLADAGDETVYVPFERAGDATTARYGFVTGNAARTFAAKVGAPHVEDVTLSDPNDPIPDE